MSNAHLHCTGNLRDWKQVLNNIQVSGATRTVVNTNTRGQNEIKKKKKDSLINPKPSQCREKTEKHSAKERPHHWKRAKPQHRQHHQKTRRGYAPHCTTPTGHSTLYNPVTSWQDQSLLLLLHSQLYLWGVPFWVRCLLVWQVFFLIQLLR